MKQKLFSKDFTLVVIGQIISLFGNAAIRFALPLYLLNQTGSPALYGAVTACAFLPAVMLSPVGGVAADRVNKRNIMTALDFFTAFVILFFYLCRGGQNLIPLLTVTLMLLYGIAGAYQPAVSASVPALVSPEKLIAANSVINMISSLASLLGPVLGGLLYSAYGLDAVLLMCAGCFLASAVMEIFIRIPFTEQAGSGSIWETVRSDFAKSFRFIRKERPVIGKALLAVCGINLFLSAMLNVGMPYLITEVLAFEASRANRLYGFAEGAMAAGGLTGGLCAGLFARRLSPSKAGRLIIVCSACLFPMGVSLLFVSSGIFNYFVLTVCCFLIMICSTVFTVQIMSFVQAETPPVLLGKVIALILSVSMCAQPLGSALYGVLFEACAGCESAVVFFAGIVSLAIALRAGKILREGLSCGNGH
ncbi:MAG: MFS transporter [Blautia sp.]|nr:MFS transporter [Blautia sp.]MCM1201858.1 MFS transporter [Bacteroides fragilis]